MYGHYNNLDTASNAMLSKHALDRSTNNAK